MSEVTTLLQKGIAAARSDRPLEARQLLQLVVQADPDNEMAWLWLSSLMATSEQKRKCLIRVLRANPDNSYARAGLARIIDVPPTEMDEVEARLAAVTSGFNPRSRGALRDGKQQSAGPNPGGNTPALAAKNHTALRVGKPGPVEPKKEPIRTVSTPPDCDRNPSPVPLPLEVICPGCDQPIPSTVKMCPHCFLEIIAIEKLLGRDRKEPAQKSV